MADDDAVVVLGGGQAGFEVCAALRANGFPGALSLVCGEGGLPYGRPALSKSYLTAPVDVSLRPARFFADRHIDVVSQPAVGLDRRRRVVVLRDGGVLPYGRLVLATGARPRRLDVPGAGLDGVLSLRTRGDADALSAHLVGGAELVVVGGGLIGMEVAAAARARGCAVTVVEASGRVMARAACAETGAIVTAEHARRQVAFRFGRAVAALHGDGNGRVRQVELTDGERLPADLVLVATGVHPEVAVARAAGLAVGDGIIVDEHLRTSDRLVYAVGDCASFPSQRAGRRIRLESVQNATDQARCVAAGIGGAPVPYETLPWFWTEQFDLRIQIAGLSHGHDRVVVVGDATGGRFSVCCLRRGRLVAVESVNNPRDHMAARRLLAGPVAPGLADLCDPSTDLRALAVGSTAG